MWLVETEGAKFGPVCLTDLKNRGLKDLFVACIDGRSGFAEAIHVASPAAKARLRQAETLLEAERALNDFASAGDAKYPTISKRRRPKWSDPVTLFDFPEPIRKASHTTNAIESVNRVLHEFTRDRTIYPSAESALRGASWRSERHRRSGPCRSPTGNRRSTTSPSSSRADCRR